MNWKTWTKARVMPGFSVALLTGKTVQTAVSGEAQWFPQPAPLQPHMLYDVASLTKVIGTTTVFLHAWDQGLVSPDMPLHRFLPDFPHNHFSTGTHAYSGLEGYIPHRNAFASPGAETGVDDATDCYRRGGSSSGLSRREFVAGWLGFGTGISSSQFKHSSRGK